MNPSLYEMLTQNFVSGINIHDISDKDQIILSVLDNIQRILACRQGSLTHLRDYGLPDFSKILQGLPASAHQLINNITHSIAKYEPRISQIHVKLLPQKEIGHLNYELTLQIRQVGSISCYSDFSPEGKVVLEQLKKANRVL